jgi:hypothetical protein
MPQRGEIQMKHSWVFIALPHRAGLCDSRADRTFQPGFQRREIVEFWYPPTAAAAQTFFLQPKEVNDEPYDRLKNCSDSRSTIDVR